MSSIRILTRAIVVIHPSHQAIRIIKSIFICIPHISWFGSCCANSQCCFTRTFSADLESVPYATLRICFHRLLIYSLSSIEGVITDYISQYIYSYGRNLRIRTLFLLVFNISFRRDPSTLHRFAHARQ